jgi:hypothetical protein
VATEAVGFSTIVDATRALFVDAPAGNDVWLSILWSIAITAVSPGRPHPRT